MPGRRARSPSSRSGSDTHWPAPNSPRAPPTKTPPPSLPHSRGDMQPQQKTNHSKHLQTQTRNFELNSTEWHPTQPHSAACRAVVSCRSHDRGGEQTVRAASTAPRCARRVRTLSTELHAIEAAGPAGSLLGGHWRSVPSSRRRRVRAYPRDGARAPAAGRSARLLRCACPQRCAASRPNGRASYSTSPSKRASTFGSIAAYAHCS